MTLETGPSVARTLGQFEGGELCWFPADDRTSPIGMLSLEEAVVLDTSTFLRFDGTHAHGVTFLTRGTGFQSSTSPPA